MCEACFSFAVVSAATGFLQWSAQVSQLRSSRFLATVCAANGVMLWTARVSRVRSSCFFSCCYEANGFMLWAARDIRHAKCSDDYSKLEEQCAATSGVHIFIHILTEYIVSPAATHVPILRPDTHFLTTII